MLVPDADLARYVVMFACWNAVVHFDMTKRWAMEEGFGQADAEQLAYWDLWTDRFYPGNRRRTKGFHFPRHGARARADAFLERAIETGRLGYLGIALHCAQDAVGHGPLGHLLHVPPIDTWTRRSETIRRRTEEASKRLLRAFRDRRDNR